MTGDLVVLLHLCDSLFPLGSFAHSDGLEAATSRGHVQDGRALRAWLDGLLQTTLRQCEGPVVARSWQHMRDGNLALLAALDAESSALRPSSTGRDASRAMGTRLLKTWSGLRPTPALLAATESLAALSLPSAFGAVCASADLGQPESVGGFLYTRLAATVSAAMRLIPLGQHEAHAGLVACLDDVPAVTTAIVNDRSPVMAFAPAFDIAAMRQQYVHSRLFRS